MGPLEYKELFTTSYPKDLDEIVEMLDLMGVQYTTEAPGTTFNPNLNFDRTTDAVRLLVREDQYDYARGILVDAGYLADVSEEEGYREMLGGLDDDELKEIVVNHKVYPKGEVAMAHQLLRERGIDLKPQEIAKERQAAAQEERKPKNMHIVGKILWGLFAVALSPLGFVATIAILFLRNRDLTGKPYYYYNRPTRIYGFVLLFISVALFLAWIFGVFTPMSWIWH